MANVALVKEKVQNILVNNFNGVELTKQGGFTLRHESARAFVKVWAPDESERTFVSIEVPLLFNVKPTPQLFEHIALHADDHVFGHLSASQGDEGILVMFSHSLLGDYLDSEELTSAIYSVLGSGNHLDNELQAQFGGEVYHDD